MMTQQIHRTIQNTIQDFGTIIFEKLRILSNQKAK